MTRICHSDAMCDLDKKIKDSIRILKTGAQDKTVELAYSGGKDSDVILALAKMADISIRPIYKCTTIDPPGTIKHVRDNGVEVVKPKEIFFQLIEKHGFPTMRARFCCDKLKEYKIMDDAIQGIRRCESVKRTKNYKEPFICRIYGSKKNHVNVILPILEWTDDDVREFVEAYGIKCHPLYYDEDGKFCVEKRLGCLACPLQGDRGLEDFKTYPKLVRCWLKAGKKWWDRPHEPKKGKPGSRQKFDNVYQLFCHNIFFDSYSDFNTLRGGLFGTVDCKAFLEDYFKIDLTL